MTILIETTYTCRHAGKGQDWYSYDRNTARFDTVEDALAHIRAVYPNVKGRQPIYIDTKSRGTIQCGWIYSRREEQQDRSRANGRSTVYCRDWVSLMRVTSETDRTAESIDVKALKVAS